MLTYLIFNDQDTSNTKLQAVDGQLDLSEITKEEEIVALSGEWRFIGHKFLEPANFPDHAPIEKVPGPWQADAEYGTYQLKIKLPPHFKK